MARYTPLLCGLRGKLGALVYLKNLTVRSYAVPEGTSSAIVRNSFANLTKMFPNSVAEYKEACATRYRKAKPDCGLARQVPHLPQAIYTDGNNCWPTRDMILPEQMDSLPGRYGVEWQLGALVISALTWVPTGLAISFACWDWRGPRDIKFAYLIMDGQLALLGHGQENLLGAWLGVMCVTVPACQAGQVQVVIDARALEEQYLIGKVFYAAATWWIDPDTGKRIVLGGCYGGWNLQPSE